MDTKELLIIELKNYFAANSALYDIESAFLYGSWARGRPRDDSDVDIAVRFANNNLDDNDIFQKLTDIALTLCEKLPREVNVIPILIDFQKPMLYYNAIILGVPIFFSDFSKYADLKNEAMFQMEDFSIFGTGWQLRAARNKIRKLKSA